jgi:hypothetical protein
MRGKDNELSEVGFTSFIIEDLLLKLSSPGMGVPNLLNG